MPDEKPLRIEEASEPPVNSEIADLARTFVGVLETEFIQTVPAHAPEESLTVLRRYMVSSFIAAMTDTGASRAEIASLLQDARNGLLEQEDVSWSDRRNQRRILLIDLSIQGELSRDEAFELEQLTYMMRREYDTEDWMPMEGTRKLRERLMDMEEKTRDAN
jgi:hypothetical protein